MQSAKGFLITLQKHLLNLGHYFQENNLRKFANLQIKLTKTFL